MPFFEKKTAGPGVHALVIGVSDYPHLLAYGEKPPPDAYGMSKLSASALSALRFADWLIANQNKLVNRDGTQVPLASVRLLASPTAEEVKKDPRLNSVDRATLQNILVAAKEWRDAAGTSRQNVTYFYFVGHGVQRSRSDSVLLLEEFGDGIGGALRNAVTLVDLHSGLSVERTARPEMAQTQYYFVDACRSFPKQFANYRTLQTTSVFNEDLPDGEDDRTAPVFLAALGGAAAYAVKQQYTLFNHALLACLEGGAGDNLDFQGRDRWCVTYRTLAARLQSYVDDLNAKYKSKQQLRSTDHGDDAVMALLDGAPLVEVRIEIAPAHAREVTRVALEDDGGAAALPLTKPLHPHPFTGTLPAGFYRLSATIEPPTVPFRDSARKTYQVSPPRRHLKVEVAG